MKDYDNDKTNGQSLNTPPGGGQCTARTDTGADKFRIPEPHRLPHGTSGNTGAYRNDTATPEHTNAASSNAREDWNRRKALAPRERGTRTK